MSVTDPLLWETRLSDSGGIIERLKNILSIGFLFNFIIPFIIVVGILWMLRKKYTEKKGNTYNDYQNREDYEDYNNDYNHYDSDTFYNSDYMNDEFY